jgi:hypothetical protein
MRVKATFLDRDLLEQGANRARVLPFHTLEITLERFRIGLRLIRLVTGP